jgi:hypothetical protein
LVLHSDGLTKNWQNDIFLVHLSKQSAQGLAEQLFSKLRLENDDATIIVAR